MTSSNVLGKSVERIEAPLNSVLERCVEIGRVTYRLLGARNLNRNLICPGTQLRDFGEHLFGMKNFYTTRVMRPTAAR